METVITIFFTLFFGFSLLCIAYKIYSLRPCKVTHKIRLYNNKDYNTDLKDTCVGRLSDASVRSSVRYHKSLYNANESFEKYKKEVNSLKWP